MELRTLKSVAAALQTPAAACRGCGAAPFALRCAACVRPDTEPGPAPGPRRRSQPHAYAQACSFPGRAQHRRSAATGGVCEPRRPVRAVLVAGSAARRRSDGPSKVCSGRGRFFRGAFARNGAWNQDRRSALLCPVWDARRVDARARARGGGGGGSGGGASTQPLPSDAVCANHPAAHGPLL